MLPNMLDAIKNALIVSCQAESGFPLNTPDRLAALAETAIMGGARGIRASGPENIMAIRERVSVPVIGIYKKEYPGSEVIITPTMDEVEAVVAAGATILALDATCRRRPDGRSFADLVGAVRSRFDIPVMADISTLEEGVTAAANGVDLLAPTLAGYTPYSRQLIGPGPDLQLTKELVRLDVPVIAEGRMQTPQDVRAAFAAGVHAVVVGSMITRPHLITRHFLTGVPKPKTPIGAIDIGGTKIAAAISAGVDWVDRERAPTPADADAVVNTAIDLLQRLIHRNRIGSLAAIGVATGGGVDHEGRIASATDIMPGFAGTDLRTAVADAFGVPVGVMNDGHAAALAEAETGAGSGYAMVLGLTIGTGLGGGIVRHGELYRGGSGLAGSVGHLIIEPGGRPCSCGGSGCAEAYVSGGGLLQTYNEAATTAATTAAAVAELAAAGDETAVRAVAETGRRLGQAIAAAAATLDPDVVVAGGSVATLGEPLLGPAREFLAANGFAAIASIPILPARHGADASLTGAALLATRLACVDQ